MSLIDPAIVKVLIDTQIETVSGSVIQTIMHAGDVVPHNKDRWIKVVAIDLDSLPMDREDATDATGLDAAAITVTVSTDLRCEFQNRKCFSNVFAADEIHDNTYFARSNANVFSYCFRFHRGSSFRKLLKSCLSLFTRMAFERTRRSKFTELL